MAERVRGLEKIRRRISGKLHDPHPTLDLIRGCPLSPSGRGVKGNAFLLICLFLLPLCGTALAEEFSILAAVDRTQAAVNEPVHLSVRISGAGSDVPQPEVPQMPGFEVYAAGRSQNVSIVDGAVSTEVVFTYTLVPRSPGNQTIPSISVARGGRTYATQPINVSVTNAAPGGPSGGPAASGGASQPKLLFVTGELNKHSPFVGEQVVYTFRFYRRVNLLSRPGYRPPDFSGFVAEDLQPRAYQGTVGGVSYAVDELRYAIFPATSGQFTIGPATLQVSVANFGGGDPMQMFFGGGEVQTVRTSPIEVNVRPLPAEGKPANFSGAVGSYRIAASLDKKSVAAGQPVTLTVELSGRGLVKSLREPAWPEIAGARRYETVTGLTTRNEGTAIEGAKTFKVILVPQTTGTLRIPPVSYPCFDPGEGRYVTLRSEPLSLTVKPGSPGAASAFPPTGAGGRAGVKTMQADIRFLKPDLGRAPPGSRATGSAVFWALLLLPAAFFVSGAGVSWKRKMEEGDPAAARASNARRSAERRLAEARKLAGGAALEFHASLHEVLVNFLADRWNVSPSGLTLSSAEAKLRARGVPADLLEKVRALWEEADRIRYAPQAASTGEPGRNLAAARELVAALEKWI